jgi:uridine kinase
MPPLVIAIAGTSGAGKTTLTKRLAATLGDSVCLYLDRYPDHYLADGRPWNDLSWIEEGCNPDNWFCPQFAEHIGVLKSGGAVTTPGTHKPAGPAQFIIIEEPLGRARPDVRDLIDFATHISVPLDIALCRTVLRSLGNATNREEREMFLQKLERNLTKRYLIHDHPIYEAITRLAPGTCDIAVDGFQTSAECERDVMQALSVRYSDRISRPQQ